MKVGYLYTRSKSCEGWLLFILSDEGNTNQTVILKFKKKKKKSEVSVEVRVGVYEENDH